MAYDISFAELIFYDAGKPGIAVDVTLRLQDVYLTIAAKVDTGSTYCIFARIYGERLGFDIESGEPQLISTATGSFQTFGHGVTLKVGELTFDAIVFFAQDENFNRNVLGRHGWLDRVVIGINDYEGKLYLSRYNES